MLQKFNLSALCLLAVMVLMSGYGVLCDYVVEVELRSYTNDESRAVGNNGACCDSVSLNSHDFNDNSCTNTERCDNLFAFCLRPSNTPSTSSGGCLKLPTISTNIVSDSDSLDFAVTDIGVPNPMTFTISGSWDGIQFYVGVIDQDDDDDDDLVDEFAIEFSRNLLDSAGLTLSGVRGINGYGSIRLFAIVYCTPMYHGDKCQFMNVCERDAITCNGNGVCNALSNTSTCICNSGFTGENCELIDYCFEQNCNQNGVCTNEDPSFSCTCNPGFTGNNCSININDCEGIVCNENGQCVDETNGYRCECATGFSGLNCTINIDECDGQNCSGNGECMDGINSYTCVCDAGYTGDDCTININDCEHQNCSGNGECTDEINSYSCVCIPGFTGSNCEINIDDCANQDCNEVGSCIDGINSFECECNPPFTGSLCEGVDYCYGTNCNGNGHCISEQTNFTCQCKPGFTGELCSVDIQSPGSENGVIVEALVGGVTAALILLVVVIVLLLGAIGCLVKKRKTIITTYFPNGTANGRGDNPLYGIPNNSLDRNSSVKQSNTMRSDTAEFENTLYASIQSAEVCNPDYGDVDLKKIPYHKNITQ